MDGVWVVIADGVSCGMVEIEVGRTASSDTVGVSCVDEIVLGIGAANIVYKGGSGLQFG